MNISKNNKLFASILGRINYLTSIVLIFISCSDNSTVESETEASFLMILQNALYNGLNKCDGKGVSAAIIFPDGTEWTCVSGISHGSTKINEDMVFSIGSITKTFTAMTIMQLYEEGKLSLDDSLSKWLPDYTNIDNSVTIRHLLNHTSGIYDIAANPQFSEIVFGSPESFLDPEDLLNSLTLEPIFEKGSDWQYSNTNYLLLRLVIRKVTGNSPAFEYRNRFLNTIPLSESFTFVEENLPLQVAHGWYDIDGDNLYEDISQITLNSFYSAADGGVFSTAKDLALWMRAIFIDQNVVSQNTLSQMVDFYSPCNSEELLAGYGLGIEWFEPTLFNNIIIWGHGGDPVGYAAAGLFLPDYNICIGFLDNTDQGDAMPILFDIVELIQKEFN